MIFVCLTSNCLKDTTIHLSAAGAIAPGWTVHTMAAWSPSSFSFVVFILLPNGPSTWAPILIANIISIRWPLLHLLSSLNVSACDQLCLSPIFYGRCFQLVCSFTANLFFLQLMEPLSSRYSRVVQWRPEHSSLHRFDLIVSINNFLSFSFIDLGSLSSWNRLEWFQPASH